MERKEQGNTETRIALIGIIVEDDSATDHLNSLLHEYRNNIIGRMGLPYRDRGICIISVVVDAPEKTISALSGKLGMLPGINVKTIYGKTGM